MKAYLITTSTIFGLLVVAHVWRMIVESGLANPEYFAITALAGAMCVWGLSLLRRTGTAPRG